MKKGKSQPLYSNNIVVYSYVYKYNKPSAIRNNRSTREIMAVVEIGVKKTEICLMNQ